MGERLAGHSVRIDTRTLRHVLAAVKTGVPLEAHQI